MTGPLLLERLQKLRDIVEPVPLGNWPTPLEPLEMPGMPSILVKREDLSSEFYGGNKVRNLEWILGAARKRAKATLLTTAALGSHFVLALAIHGARSGFEVRAVLYPQPVDDEVRESLRQVIASGARVVRCGGYLGLPWALAREWGAVRRDTGATPFWVPPGGASPLGSLGYVQAALEIATQVERGEIPPPDYLYCAAGSCGTVVGLQVGFALAGLPVQIVGVRVVPRVVTLRLNSMVRRLRRFLRRHAGVEVPASPAPILIHDQVGRGYGHPTEAGRRESQWIREHTDLRLDHTYTAKVMAGMREFIAHRDLSTSQHLFLLTCDTTPRPIDAESLTVPEGFGGLLATGEN